MHCVFFNQYNEGVLGYLYALLKDGNVVLSLIALLYSIVLLQL